MNFTDLITQLAAAKEGSAVRIHSTLKLGPEDALAGIILKKLAEDPAFAHYTPAQLARAFLTINWWLTYWVARKVPAEPNQEHTP